jgi:predicted alpha/beta superfamily hydrolase
MKWISPHMPCVLAATLLACVVSCLGQSQRNSAAEVLKIQSEILKQPRFLSISKPDGYDGGTDRYPVLYLLDAESNLEYTAAIVHTLAGNEFIPQMIVVGINSGDNAHRTHDLTPSSQAEIDNRFSPGNGGADTFFHLLVTNLFHISNETTELAHTGFSLGIP